MNIDLHMHTSNSDGVYSTKELLKMCEDADLDIISITDHESVQAYFDIKKEKLSFDGKIITGIELSFSKDGRLFDILGYGIDLKIVNNWLNQKYPENLGVKNQESILKELKSKYKKIGLKFDKNIVVKNGNKSEAYNLMKASVRSFDENREIAPEFWEKNFYKLHHTNKDSKYFVDETKYLPTVEETVEIIHKAGGVAVLAHSGSYGFSEEKMIDYIEYAISVGVDGLEQKYNSHTEKQEEIISNLAKKYNLFVTGGSDFHGGDYKRIVYLGKVYNNQTITQDDVRVFLNKIGEHNFFDVTKFKN